MVVTGLANAVLAQDARRAIDTGTPLTVTALASSDRVRFTASSSVVQIRLEVYSSTGKKIFDNEVRGGNVLDWHLQNGQAAPIADDTYLCAVTVKSLDGSLTQRVGSVAFERGAVSIIAVDRSQMTAQQLEAVGPVEENSSLTVLTEGESQTTTVIAHNGEDGLITRGQGALSFRIGDFFSGKDTEQMRLTAEGNLGIGITHPQVRLDVDGSIRASQGIVFPDGSVQYSAASKTFGARSLLPGQSKHLLAQGQEHMSPDTTGTGTTGKIAKWVDGPGGLLGDSLITESGGSIGINGSPNPNFKLDVNGTTLIRGSNPAFNLVGLRPAGNQWVFQTVDDDGRFRLFGQDNVNPGQERLTIKLDTGNVGIGATNPTSAKLQVSNTVLDRHLYLSSAAPSLALGNNDTRSSASMNSIFALATSPGHFGVEAGGLTIANYGSSRGNIYINSNYDGAGETHVILQPNSGRVGIGTTAPTYKFEVQANGDAQNGTKVTGGDSTFSMGGEGLRALGGNSQDNNGGRGLWAMGGASGNTVIGSGGLAIVAYGGDGHYAGGGLFASGGFADGPDAYAGKGMVVQAGGHSNGAHSSPAIYVQGAGDVEIAGDLLVHGVKNFKIDHPLDPENKYLFHASIESSEVLNLYSGNVVLGSNGEAIVTLPDWFGALNRDFRYQLTAIGAPAQGLYIAEKINKNRFKIAGGHAGLEVSWQISGVRSDAVMLRHPLKVEVDKPARERGTYLRPDAYDQPEERSVEWAIHPDLMRQIKTEREKRAERKQKAQ